MTLAYTELDRIRSLLPACPTCGGDGELAEPLGDCPDCVDGKASIEWMAAVFNRVFMFPAEERTEASWAYDEGWRACIDHLRGVR